MKKQYFKTHEDAQNALLKFNPSKDPLDRFKTAEALAVSTATLHRVRKRGQITATITEINNLKLVSYSHDEVALAMFKMGGLS